MQNEQKELCTRLSQELSDYLRPTGYVGKTVRELRGSEVSHFEIKKSVSREQVLKTIESFYTSRGCRTQVCGHVVKVFVKRQFVATVTIQPHGYGALSVFIEPR